MWDSTNSRNFSHLSINLRIIHNILISWRGRYKRGKFPSLTFSTLARSKVEGIFSLFWRDICCSMKEKLSRMDSFELLESLKVQAPLSPFISRHFNVAVRWYRINRRYDLQESNESLLVISFQRSALSLKDGSCLHPCSATFLHLPARNILYPSPSPSSIRETFVQRDEANNSNERKKKEGREKRIRVGHQSMIHHGGDAIFPLASLIFVPWQCGWVYRDRR